MSRSALGFESDSGDDKSDEGHVDSRSMHLKNKQIQRSLVNKQILAQQSTIKKTVINSQDNEYDDVYDSIQQSRNLKLKKINGDNKSRYINNLLQAKKQRDEDKLKIQDIKVQKERELEGDLYKDKEVFVTAGYKEYKNKASDHDDDDDHNVDKFNMEQFYNEVQEPKNESKEIEPKDIEKIEDEVVKLMPKLSIDEINEAKKRYFERLKKNEL